MHNRYTSTAIQMIGVLLFTTPALVACGSGQATSKAGAGFERVTSATLTPGDTLPSVTGTPALTVEPLNGPASSVAFDLTSLERLGLVRATIYEPFEKKQLNFSGVELADVLTMAHVPTTAGVHLTALDDYQADLTAADIAAGGLMLATRLDGQPIPVASGGPTRLVFTEGTKAGLEERQWIWSVNRIEVKP